MTVIELPSTPFELKHGGHGSTFNGCACASELISLMSGQPFSDKGVLLSPPVNRLAIALNERLREGDEIAKLLPLLPYAIGTRDDGRDKERQRLCTEWLLYTTLPRWLDLAGETEYADKIRALPGDLAVEGVITTLREVRDHFWTGESPYARIRRVVREAVEAEFKKRGWEGAAEAAVAAGAVEAAGAAVAAGAAGAAVAAEAVEAAVAAEAVEAAEAAVAAEAVEAAVAAVAAEAAEAAVAAEAPPSLKLSEFKRAFREEFVKRIRPAMDEKFGEIREQTLNEGLDLFKKLANTEVREDLIVIENWREVCGIEVQAA